MRTAPDAEHRGPKSWSVALAALLAAAATSCGGNTMGSAGPTDAAATGPDARLDAGSPDSDAQSDVAPCPPNQSMCAGTCTDTLVDSTNCGACGVACASGEVCSAGSCSTTCGSGLSLCAGDGGAPYCASLQTDNANCGACGTTCPPGQVCSGGQCATTCAAPQTRCGGDGGAAYCANLQTDNTNCGTCRTTCPAGQVCSSGMCATTCGAPLTHCGAADGGGDAGAAYCADLQSDTDNCGGCGVKCGPYAHAAAACVQGQCREICDAGYLDCSGTGTAGCNVDSQTDPDNCNGCGTVCGPYPHATAQCSSGQCSFSCSGAWLDCDGDTYNGCEIDSSHDAHDCGTCGNACYNEGCSGGVCRKAIAIGAGRYHTCAVLDDGSVWCWGSNVCGQVGPSAKKYEPTPVLVAGVTGATQVEGGPRYSCALVAGGAVQCWGQLPGTGVGSTEQPPTFVPGLSGVVSLAVGSGSSLNDSQHACALLGNATVECWGRNRYGQLGDGTTTSRTTPAPVPGLSDVLGIAAGGGHTCAIMGDRSVECWGNNSDGQLGNGTTSVSVPTPQPISSGLAFAQLACGGLQTCAQAYGGPVYCWGKNDAGQLGDGTTTQRLVPTQSLAPGGFLSAFDDLGCETSGGAVYCWGGYELGYGSTPKYTGAQYADTIAVGREHVCAIDSGWVECWGVNQYGQLGDGTWKDRIQPLAVVWP